MLQGLENLKRLTTGALAELRILLMELRPSALIEASLATLMEQLAKSAMSVKRVTVSVNVTGEFVKLPPDVHVGLYRLAQEAVNNAAKHSKATKINIALSGRQQDGVVIEVSDDGRGFDLKKYTPGLGLNIMCERGTAIGAFVDLRSEIDKGTRIVITWPAKNRSV